MMIPCLEYDGDPDLWWSHKEELRTVKPYNKNNSVF